MVYQVGQDSALFPLGDLLEHVYEEGTRDVPDWVSVLDRVAHYVGATHGQLVAGRFSSGRPSTAVLSGLDQRDFSGFLEEYGASDPRLPLIQASFGLVVHETDIEPDGFDRHPIVLDHLDRFDIRHFMGLGCGAAGDEACLVGVMRSRTQGPFSRDAARHFGLLARHVARAHDMHARLSAGSRLTASQLLSSGAPDAMVLLLDALGSVAFVDGDGAGLLGRTGAVRLGKRLELLDREGQRRISAALAATQRAGGAADCGKVFILREPHTDSEKTPRPLAARLVALPATHPLRVLLAPTAVLALHLKDIGARNAAIDDRNASLLASAFGLTPREARLASFLGSGRSLEEASRSFGVSRFTLRAQLQSILGKSGTRRQAELVWLVQRVMQV